MNDSFRQISNLILAPMMWVCSSLGFIFPSARSPADMSDANTSLLVPSGIAFSIWLPIFALCITYGVIQALPKNKTRDIFRIIGPWSAAGFFGVCLWGIVNAFAPITPTFDWAQWGTAIIFVPTMLLLVKAMLLVTDHKEKLLGLERYAAYGGLSMIAGWCSIAVFLNWTPQMVGMMTGAGMGMQIANIVMLSLALLWAVFIIRKSGANRVYAFPIIWGLAFVVLKRATVEPMQMMVLVAAAIGIAVLITTSVIRPKAAL
ncbi:hypothetical protein [Fretibacter rubidus]|uniref:hypothetical protein n=1 Tax=Fretibacter rubidus TaxID=570162 RepID=UPI00352A5BC9